MLLRLKQQMYTQRFLKQDRMISDYVLLVCTTCKWQNNCHKQEKNLWKMLENSLSITLITDIVIWKKTLQPKLSCLLNFNPVIEIVDTIKRNISIKLIQTVKLKWNTVLMFEYKNILSTDLEI